MCWQPEVRPQRCPRLLADGALGNGPRPEMTFFGERDYYEIPLDCLRPAGLDNVLAAGRCLSAAKPGR
jgi:hypothetical protein